VLELSEEPVIGNKVAPLGYFAPGQDGQALAEALQQLPDVVGIFDKPRYFNYKSDICAHSRRGVTGCTNCLDACPADAITSTGKDLINVNPNLCQGCGSCTVACPSGAISYSLPTLDVSIDRLRQMLQQYQLESSQPAQLLIHDLNQASEQLEAYNYPLADNVIPFSIEEIGALGQPFWFTAMAYGVSRIVIWDARSHNDHDWLELQASIDEANLILSVLGLGEARVQFVSSADIKQLKEILSETVTDTGIATARYAGVDDKRRMLTMALSHLHQQAAEPPQMLTLSDSAAFGEIEVDKQACTLCMSCVSVCPAGALVDGVDKPQLNFIEDLCVQCGMCERACPEKAIDLRPRYVFDRNAARLKRLLHEEPVFHCISCQKPFATQKMIDTMMAKLADHPMFQGPALNRLKMCEDCRVKAMFK
jgi:ferredoxin